MDAKPTTESPWYQAGLRFACTQCGNCCSGAPGYVWVNQAEIQQLAELAGLDVEAFERQYVRRVGLRKTLVERPNGDCVFLDGETRKCNVYAARPRQCRTWPFWESNVRTPEAWQKTCEVCPGSGRGNLYPVEEILRHVEVIKL
jgi:Fe-S-cluster containining protein